MGKSGVRAKRSCLGVWATIPLKARTLQKVSQSLGPCQAGRCQGTRKGQVVAGHPPRGHPLANHLQKHSPKLYITPVAKTAAAPRRARTAAPQPYTVELRGPGRPPFQRRGRSRLPLTSLVAAVAEGPGAEPGVRPGGARSRRNAGPPRASRLGAAARPPRPCAGPTLPCPLGSDPRCALLTPEEKRPPGWFRVPENRSSLRLRLLSPCSRPGGGVG